MTPEERWRLYMGRSEDPMLTEQQSRAICAKCKRWNSLAQNIVEAWDKQHDSIDGYRNLAHAIGALRSEM